MQQHIENSIGGSSQECDWAVFDHASWKDDGQTIIGQMPGDPVVAWGAQTFPLDSWLDPKEIVQPFVHEGMTRTRGSCGASLGTRHSYNH
jgi:hypothetical protein